MSEDLQIKVRKQDKTARLIVASIGGKLNEETAAKLKGFAAAAAKGGVKRVVLDAGELKYMGSGGMDAAVEFAKKLQQDGGGLSMTNVNPKIKVVLDTLDLVDTFRVCDTLKEAVAAVTQGVKFAPKPVKVAPRFEDAVARLKNFLGGQGLNEDVQWIFREDVAVKGGETLVYTPLPEGNAAAVRAHYESGRKRWCDLSLKVACLLDLKPCAYIVLGPPGPQPGKLQLGVPKQPRLAFSEPRGLLTGILGGGPAEGWVAEVPKRSAVAV